MPINDILNGNKLPNANQYILGYNLKHDKEYYLPIHMTKFSMKMHMISLVATSTEEKPNEQYKLFKSHAIEIKALNSSIHVCNDKLRVFTCSIDDDEAILSKPVSSYTTYCAVVYRKEQKKVLVNQIQLLEFCVKINKDYEKGMMMAPIMESYIKERGLSMFEANLLRRKAKNYFEYLKI